MTKKFNKELYSRNNLKMQIHKKKNKTYLIN